MANYTIPENPEYTTEIRKLENTDPANAETMLNPLVETLIGNTHAVKLEADRKPDKKSCRFIIGTSTNGWTEKD